MKLRDHLDVKWGRNVMYHKPTMICRPSTTISSIDVGAKTMSDCVLRQTEVQVRFSLIRAIVMQRGTEEEAIGRCLGALQHDLYSEFRPPILILRDMILCGDNEAAVAKLDEIEGMMFDE